MALNGIPTLIKTSEKLSIYWWTDSEIDKYAADTFHYFFSAEDLDID